MNTGEIWRGVADRLEQMIEEQDEALREAPEYEHTYSVYLELVTHFRGEIEKLRADLAESQEQLRMTLVSYNATHATLQLEIDKLRNERDEARRVARHWYQKAQEFRKELDDDWEAFTRNEPPTSRVDATESDA